MPQRTLRFKIRPDGRVEERVEGIDGGGCLDLTERLESALGSVERREATSEAYRNRATQSQPLSVEQL